MPYLSTDTALRDNNMRLKLVTGERLALVGAIGAMVAADHPQSGGENNFGQFAGTRA